MILNTIMILYIIAIIITGVCLTIIYDVATDRRDRRFIRSAIIIMSILWPLTMIYSMMNLFDKEEK